MGLGDPGLPGYHDSQTREDKMGAGAGAGGVLKASRLIQQAWALRGPSKIPEVSSPGSWSSTLLCGQKRKKTYSLVWGRRLSQL